MREQWCSYYSFNAAYSTKKTEDKPVQSTYFAVEPSCFRMLRDCRSMLAVESHQLFYPIFYPAPNTSTQGLQLRYFIRGKKVQTLWLCVLGRQFSFSFQECALQSHLTQASEWGSCTHEVSAMKGEIWEIFIVILRILFYYYYYSGLTVTLWFKS